MKSHHDHSNSYKGKHLIGARLQFKSLVYYCHGRWHPGRLGARVLHLDPKETEKGCPELLRPQIPPSTPKMTDSFNKATLTPTSPQFLTVPLPVDQTFKHRAYSHHHIRNKWFYWVNCLLGLAYHGENIEANNLFGDSISGEEEITCWAVKSSELCWYICHSCLSHFLLNVNLMGSEYIPASLTIFNLFILCFLYEVIS